MPDGRVVPEGGDPAEVVESRESIRLAFVAALQHLPPRQRAVLILREVLRWKASEVAELLDTSVASVNSALQRARATLEAVGTDEAETLQPADGEQRALLDRYVDAFERYDMDRLTSLLREDATWSMPPYDMWLQTHDDIRAWCLGPGIGCRGSRLIPTEANGMPAFGQYKPSPDGGLEPWSLQVLEISNGEIAGISFFLDTEQPVPAVRATAPARPLTQPARPRAGQDVAQARQHEQVLELPTCPLQLDPVPQAPRRQLQPGEAVDRDHVRFGERTDVARDRTGVAALEQLPRALAQRGDAVAGDRADHDQHGASRPRPPAPRDRLQSPATPVRRATAAVRSQSSLRETGQFRETHRTRARRAFPRHGLHRVPITVAQPGSAPPGR